MLLLSATGVAVAQTYTVSRTDDPIPGSCESGDCSLREALMAANGTTTVDDVIVLPASPTPYLIQYEELALPISDEAEVRGAGANQTVVEGDGKEVVFTVSAKATLSGLTLTGGKGGIDNTASLALRGVAVESNEREGFGGGIQANGPLTVESSTIGFNKTPGISGGGIQANAPVTVVNSTFTENSSMAISTILGNSAVTIASSAFVSNRSEGLGAYAVRGTPLTVRDSVFFDNRSTTGIANCLSFSPVVSLGGNVSDDETCGTTATDKPNVDPRLGSLALHGGTTLLYDLLAGSPAIDAAGQCPAFDQRGAARPQGAACDSGPYEVEVATAPPPPPGDSEFFMKVGKKLRLGKRVIRAKLTCPVTEASLPCRGTVQVPDPPLVFPGPHTLQTRPLKGKFSILPGKSKMVALREPRGRGKRLPKTRGKWRVSLVVRAEDGAGNAWSLNRRRVLLIR